ncbi:MAG: AAA family ATPase, partial [Eubacterium sp.]|nr:AAA family ATPase [Eubacterium sp.]
LSDFSSRNDRSVRRSAGSYKDDYKAGVSEEHFVDMFHMLMESGAIIQIIAGEAIGGNQKHGVIMISLPNEMTLRMRSIISMAFPHMAAEEIRNVSDRDNVSLVDIEASGLSDYMLADSISGFLNIMYTDVQMKGIAEKNKSNDKKATDHNDNEEMMLGEGYGLEEWEFEDELISKDDIKDEAADEAIDKTYLDASIDDLDLSVRAYNCLKRASINTVGDLMDLSDEDLREIRNLGSKAREEVKCKLKDYLYRVKGLKPVSHREELNELIGLTEVKEQVKRIAAYAKMKKAMPEGCNLNTTLNMQFTGNPGTAKTTVARILAGILYDIGILSKNDVVEVGRADLAGKYVGHTADLVKSVFKKAKGKMLFIDEAYSLVDDNNNSFGDEAINTIVQEMENHRKETIVVFAGYPDKMEEFFSRNPGLKSRVPFTINFNDYSAEELTEIVEFEAKKIGFSINPEAQDKILNICKAAAGKAELGNGRFCRNLVEDAVLNYAVRVFGDDAEGESEADNNKDINGGNTNNINGEEKKENIEMELELLAEDFTEMIINEEEQCDNRMGFIIE